MNTLDLQAALSAGTSIQLPSGPTYVDRPTERLGNPDRLSDIRLRGEASIIGDSDGTSRLVMRGGAGAGSRYLIDVLSGRLTIRNVLLDGSERENLSEQCHLLHVSEGASLIADHCGHTLPALSGTGTGGDGIKVTGGKDITIRNCWFERCDRSGISIHHGSDITIEDCTFNSTGDADIDIEPPADQIVSNVQIRRINVIRTRPGDSVQLTRCTDVELSDADLGGGNLTCISATALDLDRIDAGVVTIRRGGGVYGKRINATAVRVRGDYTGIPKCVVLDRVTATEILVESAEDVYFTRAKADIAVYRAEVAPTWGGLINSDVTTVLRQPRTHGIPWLSR